MRSARLYVPFAMAIAIASILTIAAPTGSAQTVKILYSSTGPSPQANVTFDAAGDLFWTANYLINELTPGSGGSWSYSEPFDSYNYNNYESDPEGTVVFDSAGNMYAAVGPARDNDGYILELTPAAGGTWTPQTIYAFPPTATYGSSPYAGLIFDTAGNLYGTTAYGGAYGAQYSGGTVFELSPQAGGGWKHQILHSFGNGTDGSIPVTKLILDSAGNLYGATESGGIYSQGTVYKLTKQPSGAWKEQILHHFGSGTDGQSPIQQIAMDAGGAIYGTTTGGGLYGQGAAFELIQQENGAWKENLIHSFGSGTDGSGPYSGVTLDAAGHVYGTTFFGGTLGGGVLFELIPHGNGAAFAEKIVHDFVASGDGTNPLAGVTFDSSGNIFGTTEGGGANGEGIVYEIVP